MTALPTGTDIKIVNVSSGKTLQANLSAEEAVAGQSWNKTHGDTQQRWRLIPSCAAKHQYYIHNVATGLVLTVRDNSNQKGARAVLRRDTEGSHSRWRLIPLADSEYAITNVGSSLAMDVRKANPDDNAVIAQYDYWHGPQQRWKLITQHTPVNTRAVFIMVRNEQVFLPVWLRYYSQFFDTEDTYVIDHQCTDGSTAGDGFIRVPVSREVFGTGWQRDLVQRYQHELIDR